MLQEAQMKEKENRKKIISPSLVMAVIVTVLGIVGMYMAFFMAYRDFALRADESAAVIRDLKDIRELLTGLFWQLQASMLMVVFGTIVVVRKLIGSAKKNEEIREKLMLLEKENREAELLMKRSMEMEHLQRLETIGTMTSGIAHEFNNILTPIMGYSTMSMDMVDPENTELMENLNEIYDASSKAKKIIQRLSALSRKEAVSRFELLSPDQILLNTEEMSQVTFPENVFLRKEYRCPEKCVMGDETQLGQVALNLVINAVQAMKAKGGTLFIRTEKDRDCVYMIFEDTGPGISEENLKEIFTPFFTTKENGKGTGLGLAIAQHIIQEHRGKITVKSEIGKGTVFTVTLPLAERNKAPDRETESRENGERQDGKA